MLGGFKWHSNRGEAGAEGRPCDPDLPGVPLNRQRDTQKLSHTLSPSAGLRALELRFELQTPPWSLALNSTWILWFFLTTKTAFKYRIIWGRSFSSTIFDQFNKTEFLATKESDIIFFLITEIVSRNLELTQVQTIHHFQTLFRFHINSGCVCAHASASNISAAHAKALAASVAAACLLDSV